MAKRPKYDINDQNGVPRRLGNVVPTTALRYTWPSYGAVPDQPVLTLEQILERLPDGLDFDDPFLCAVRDQDGVGECNADATVSGMNTSAIRRGIDDYPLLAASDLYAQINGGRDQGSLLEDGIRAAMEVGVGTQEYCGQLWKPNQYKKAPPEMRAKHRVDAAFLCPTFLHIASALPPINQNDVIIGIMWRDGYRTDGEGKLILGGGNAGGHALHSYKVCRTNRTLWIMTKNSWSEQWGKDGMCAIPKEAFGGPVGGWWAVRSVVPTAYEKEPSVIV